jgi:hypothetical protein
LADILAEKSYEQCRQSADERRFPGKKREEKPVETLDLKAGFRYN